MIDKDAILNFVANRISKEEFAKKYPELTSNPGDLVNEFLEQADKEKNAELLENILIIGFRFEAFAQIQAKILSKLIAETWHYKHEDIARILQKLKDPYSVDFVVKALHTKHDYLEYNNEYALINKCVRVLSGINTNNAKEQLQLLAASKNELLKEAALKQLHKFE